MREIIELKGNTMIKDRLVNSETYYSLSENIQRGFEWLKTNDLKNISDGRYDINDDLYVNVQTYDTKEDAKYESHRKYIDIQYMITGKEYVGVVDLNKCKTCEEYDLDKDIEFYTCSEENPYQILNEGDFLLFYPHDAHKPSINPDAKIKVKKAVVKVRI